MGTTVFGCGCSITTSMFRIGDYERPIVNVHHCLKHTINTIQQNLLVRMANELTKLINEEEKPQSGDRPPGLDS